MSTSGVYFKFGRKITGFDTFVSSGGITTLLTSSSPFQIVTGSADHTVKMPSAVSLSQHRYFNVINLGTGDISVQDNAGNSLATVGPTSFGFFRVKTIGTVAGVWTYTLSTSSGGGSSIAASDKLDFLQGVSNLKFDDGNTKAQKVEFNLHEIGGDYWRTVTSLTTARFSCANFTLRGFALAVGGFNVTCQSTVDRYDDSNKYWLNRTGLTTARELAYGWDSGGFGYVSCGDGNPVVTYLASTEQYDLTLDTWTNKASTSQARNHVNGFKQSDFGHVIGGINGSTYYDLNERYDGATNAWSFRTGMITPRREFGSFELNNKGYVFAGVTTGATPLQSSEKFLEHLNAWMSVSDFPITNSGMASFETLGFGYSAGGNSSTTTTRKYNDVSDSWVTVKALDSAVIDTSAAVLNHQGYTLGVSTPAGTVQKYKSYSYQTLGVIKQSRLLPSTILAAANLTGLIGSLPVQVRSDGEAWKNISVNEDSALADSENVKTKFREYGMAHIAGGCGAPASYPAYNSSESYNPITDVWTSRGNMATSRFHPFGFALEGYGLVCGGNTPDLLTYPSLATVERYNELIDAFSARTAMNTGSHQAQAFSLLGFGYVVGGGNIVTNGIDNNQRYSNALDVWVNKTVLPVTIAQNVAWSLLERGYVSSGSPDTTGTVRDTGYVYNPITDAWLSIANAPNADRQISGFALKDHGYRVGGVSVSATDVHKYNPETNAWATVQDTNGNATNSAGLASGGRGYRINNDSNQVSTEYYNPEANIWINTANTNVGRREATSNFTPGFFRNYELRIGLPAFIAGIGAGTWVAKTPIPAARSGCYAFNLNGNLHTASGHLSGTPQPETYKYNLELDAWRRGSDVTVSDGSSGDSGVTLEGYGYGPGGAVAGGATTAVRKFNGDLEVWSAGTAINRAHLSHGTFPLNGMMYITGGDGAGGFGGFHDQYNPQTDSWAAKTNVTQNKDQNPSEALNGYGYNFGGYNGGGSLTAVDKYHDAGDYWTTVASHTAVRRGCAGAIVDGKIHAYGGYDSGSTFNGTLEVYDDITNTWSFRSSKVTIGYGVAGAALQNTALSIGGSEAGYLANVDQFLPSQNKLVVGASLRVEE